MKFKHLKLWLCLASVFFSTHALAVEAGCEVKILKSWETTDHNSKIGCWGLGDGEKCHCGDMEIRNTTSERFRVKNVVGLFGAGRAHSVTLTDFWVDAGESRALKQCFRNQKQLESVHCYHGKPGF
jgi:hypothetical protein